MAKSRYLYLALLLYLPPNSTAISEGAETCTPGPNGTCAAVPGTGTESEDKSFQLQTKVRIQDKVKVQNESLGSATDDGSSSEVIASKRVKNDDDEKDAAANGIEVNNEDLAEAAGLDHSPLDEHPHDTSASLKSNLIGTSTKLTYYPIVRGDGAGTPWTNGIVKYCLATDVYTNLDPFDVSLQQIQKAFPCLTWVRLNTDQDSASTTATCKDDNGNDVKPSIFITEFYEHYSSRNGDHTNLGMMTGLQYSQVMNMHPYIHPGRIIPLLMHALGQRAEQTRPDRDTYITLLWDNIHATADMDEFLTSYAKDDASSVDLPYDILSIMHDSPSSGRASQPFFEVTAAAYAPYTNDPDKYDNYWDRGSGHWAQGINQLDAEKLKLKYQDEVDCTVSHWHYFHLDCTDIRPKGSAWTDPNGLHCDDPGVNYDDDPYACCSSGDGGWYLYGWGGQFDQVGAGFYGWTRPDLHYYCPDGLGKKKMGIWGKITSPPLGGTLSHFANIYPEAARPARASIANGVTKGSKKFNVLITKAWVHVWPAVAVTEDTASVDFDVDVTWDIPEASGDGCTCGHCTGVVVDDDANDDANDDPIGGVVIGGGGGGGGPDLY